MLSYILVVIVQAVAVNVFGKGAEAALEGHGDIGATQLTVIHHVVNLQVGIKEGALLHHIGIDLLGSPWVRCRRETSAQAQKSSMW